MASYCFDGCFVAVCAGGTADAVFQRVLRGYDEIDGPFFFGLASRFEELENMKDATTKVRIIRMRKVPFIDSTGVNNLRNLCERTRKRGVTVILSGVTEAVQETLVKFGVDKEIGADNIFPHIVPALAKAKELAE